MFITKRYGGLSHMWTECSPAKVRLPVSDDILSLAFLVKKGTKRIEENDLPLLRKWHMLHPKDHRIAFYLSQRLMALQRWEEVLAAYGHRIDLGGYHVSWQPSH